MGNGARSDLIPAEKALENHELIGAAAAGLLRRGARVLVRHDYESGPELCCIITALPDKKYP